MLRGGLMFIVSVRSSSIKAALLCGALLICACVCAVAAGQNITAAVVRSQNPVSYKAQDASQRISFLSQFGWAVEEEPVEVSEVIIPAEFDGAYEQYNEMQALHGLDLSKYAGRRAKRWTYTVTNYPGYENSAGMVEANIFVYDGIVIGGDICSLETDGFIRDFNFPEEEVTNGKTQD